jgi:Fur family transcriptional regulator, ferric uptake regulator
MNAKSPPCGRKVAVDSRRPKDIQKLIESLRAKLEAWVGARDLKHSEARVKILHALVHHGAHFRAQDLLESLHVRYPEVGKATLYRNLPILVEAGVLQEGPVDSAGQVFYEISDDEHHDHLVCLDCHQIFEFHEKKIEDLQAEAAHRMGFSVRDHRHVVYAACEYLKK